MGEVLGPIILGATSAREDEPRGQRGCTDQ